MWIVMSSSAKMPVSIRSPYRNVALVKLTPEYAASGELPKMLSARARGVERIEHLGHHFVGKTDSAAYQRTMAQAHLKAVRRNGGVV
jgi:hypothetical protein